MILNEASRHYIHVLCYFACTRSLEVLALQASPLLGAYLGGFKFEWLHLVQLSVLLLGSLLLTYHIFILNDWAGHESDARDPRRKRHVFSRHHITRRQVAHVATALLVLAAAAFMALGRWAVFTGALIAMLGLLYSCSPRFGKVTPVAASINHLLGGALHFLLGYTLFHDLDGRGLALSVFFGLVFAAGHLNQEIRDHEGDSINRINTSAVVFGCKNTFILSTIIFAAAYTVILVLTAADLLPTLMYLSVVPFALHMAGAIRTFHRGLGFTDILWLQQCYRLLFGIIGLAMLIR